MAVPVVRCCACHRVADAGHPRWAGPNGFAQRHVFALREQRLEGRGVAFQEGVKRRA